MAAFLILFPLAGQCAALAPDALSAFQEPGVPAGLYAKVEHGVPLTLSDVATLSSADVSKAAIIDYLYSFGGHFHLAAADVLALRNEGVSADVIDYLTSPPARSNHLGF